MELSDIKKLIDNLNEIAKPQNVPNRVTYMDWLDKQRGATGDRKVVGQFADAVIKTITSVSFQTNKKISLRQMWSMMGSLRTSPAIQLGFMGSYIMYITETGQTDSEVESIIEEIVDMVDLVTSGLQ